MPYRPEWLSEGAELLVDELDAKKKKKEEFWFDVVIVGSGYGGAVAAARLAKKKSDGKPLSVCVLERGREYVPGAFPSRFSEIPGYVRLSRFDDPKAKGRLDGLFDFRFGSDVSVLLGNGLGGGSLINASVAERPNDDVFDSPAWPEDLRRDLKALCACYDKAKQMLGAGPAKTEGLAKYAAFQTFAQKIEATARPAEIAVHFDDEINAQGVEQKKCNRCGDCVTGCNFWAKNTLAMNYLPEARRFGARLFTNATVSRIEKVTEQNSDISWRVWFGLTGDRHPPLDPPERALRAHSVILAAGTFGSTEILMRSRACGLRLSEKLGHRFSGNGDMISVLYGQQENVNAAPEETVPFEKRGVGPTITGIIEKVGASQSERVTIEELAIPAPLRRVFEEVVTTGALPVRLGIRDRNDHAPDGHDPEAINPRAIEHSQIFAAMGDDGARGRLEMVDGWETVHSDGAIAVEWEEAGADPIFESQDKVLRYSESLGGTYLRSPLWKPLPESLSGMLSGPQPDGKLFSVHPLGGCVMGDDANSGVVNHIGMVFDPTDTGDLRRTHDGLLVLDGSIVPTALGINPLLTITALAERAISHYASLRDWGDDSDAVAKKIWPPKRFPPRPETPKPSCTKVRFAERMTGKLRLSPLASETDAELYVEFAKIESISEFLRYGPRKVEIAKATLKLDDEEPVPLEGSVYWMERGRTGQYCRIARALWTYLWTRGLADWFQRLRERGFSSAIGMLSQGGAFIALASNVGEVRYLRYEMTLNQDLMRGRKRILKRGVQITGLKTFQYAMDGNPWRQLSELTVTVKRRWPFGYNAGMLNIDFLHMLRRFAAQFQVVGQLDQPTAIMDIVSIALFMARVAFKIHFWSFRAPEYERHDPDRKHRRTPGALDGLTMERHSVNVRVHSTREHINLPLTRYRRDSHSRAFPVLLIHGFGSGGIQFAHPKLKGNVVRHLAEKGFDVWVAELRTSIAVPASLSQWTLDEVAREDIPAIVGHILRETECEQLDVIAHCIGSAMFCSAVLSGDLQSAPGTGSLVRKAVLLQVGPLITLSTGNRFRGHLAAALRNYFQADHVDSSIDSNADWMDVLIDRLLYTYPYPLSERGAHSLWPPCRPHTHIANCNRSAAVFGRLFQHVNMGKGTLDALGDLLGHTNLRTFEQTVQYAFVGRLTDYDACNSYVTDENVRKFFDFPVRFLHGELNDVFHPDTTARSLKLLEDVFGERPFTDRVVIPGYGHLDPLVGNDAAAEVFPRISEFLESVSLDPPPASQPRERYSMRPLIGPILGWTRFENDRWTARVWCRTDDTQIDAHFLIAVVLDSSGNPVATYRGDFFFGGGKPWKPGDPRFAIDLVGVVDVPLPDGAMDCEIVLVGAYLSTKSHQPHPDKVQEFSEGSQKAHPEGVARLPFAPDPGPVNKLPDEYGKRVMEERKKWIEEMKNGEKARRVCDEGYDERPDSVHLRPILRKRPEQTGALDFALASCRYSASLLDREQADRMFGVLRNVVEGKVPGAPDPSLLLLVGDQIYADATAGMFDPKNRRARFYDAYREAWTAPNAREVLRKLPTYMMLDDHEINDDWHPQDRDDRRMKDWGLMAVAEYQLAHSPRNAAGLCATSASAPSRGYFYSFESSGFPFFVCDTRTGREGRERIMAEEQFEALKCWLDKWNNDRDKGDTPKFVVSPSVVVPFLHATRGRTAYASRSDGWDGFPPSLRDLFSFIASKKIRNVVFLCGDPHFSMTSKIWYDGTDARDLRTLCVVASPLYAPYPFANARPEEFLLTDLLSIPSSAGSPAMHYECIESSIVPGDSFTMVSVKRKDKGTGWHFTASVYGDVGGPRSTCLDLP